MINNPIHLPLITGDRYTFSTSDPLQIIILHDLTYFIHEKLIEFISWCYSVIIVNWYDFKVDIQRTLLESEGNRKVPLFWWTEQDLTICLTLKPGFDMIYKRTHMYFMVASEMSSRKLFLPCYVIFTFYHLLNDKNFWHFSPLKCSCVYPNRIW